MTKRIATIGTYDGVHRGHKLVIQTMLDIARQQGLKPVVFAFANHPLDLIDPASRPARLQDMVDQQRMLREMGVEVQPINFSPELMQMTSRQYMQMLRDEYGVQVLVVGYDNRFGHDRESTAVDYRRFGAELGMDVVVAPELPGVSSSAIRKMLHTGDVAGAAEALGYPYSITGTVVHGRELGRTIGFPTANIEPTDPVRLIPADGVYACRVELPDGRKYGAMANIGHRPTIRDGRTMRSIEVNIFDLQQDLYGTELKLTFLQRLRDEKKMPNLRALQQQLQQDRKQAQACLLINNSTFASCQSKIYVQKTTD